MRYPVGAQQSFADSEKRTTRVMLLINSATAGLAGPDKEAQEVLPRRAHHCRVGKGQGQCMAFPQPGLCRTLASSLA